MSLFKKLFLFSTFLVQIIAHSNQTLVVNLNTDLDAAATEGFMDLRSAIHSINSARDASSFQVLFQLPSGMETITLKAPLPIINFNAVHAVTIDGSNQKGSGRGVTISGNHLYPSFWIRQASMENPVRIQNLTLGNCMGENSGGGALFIDAGCETNSVALSNLNFDACSGSEELSGPVNLGGANGHSNPVAGSALTMSCLGTIVLNGKDIYLGSAGNTIQSGTLQIASDASLGKSTVPLLFARGSGTIKAAAAITSARPIIIAAEPITATIDMDRFIFRTSGGITGGAGATLATSPSSTGVLVFEANNNTYSGDTLLEGGTLKANAVNAFSPNSPFILKGKVILDLNGFSQKVPSFSGDGIITSISGAPTLTLTHSASSTFTGSLTGTLSIAKSSLSTGTLILSGAGLNTYAGATNLEAGVLKAGAPDAFSLNSAIILANSSASLDLNGFNQTIPSLAGGGEKSLVTSKKAAILTLTDSNSSTYSGAITGDLGIRKSKTSTGSLVLKGAGLNTYRGVTLLEAGVLRGGAVNALSGFSQHDLAKGARLDLGGFHQTIGSLKGAPESSVLLGANCLTIGRDDASTTFEGIISGNPSCGLMKVGKGTLNLAGTNTYSGNTVVSDGRLNINYPGSIAGDAIVKEGGILGGTGRVHGSVLIQPGGSLSPGASIGTIYMGPLTLMAGSTTNIEIAPALSSLIAVTGTANLEGTLNIIVDPGAYGASTTYTFLTATDGTSGTFSALTGIPEGFSAFVTGYGTNALQLIFIDPSLSLFLTPTEGGENSENLANYLNPLGSDQELQPILTPLSFLQGEALNAALNSINPARATLVDFAASNEMLEFSDLIHSRIVMQKSIQQMGKRKGKAPVAGLWKEERLIAANDKMGLPHGSPRREEERSSLWLDGFFGLSSQEGINQMPDVSLLGEGAFLGFECLSFEHGIFGFSAGYARTNLSFENSEGEGGVNSYMIGPYGAGYFDKDRGYFELGFFGSFLQENNQRHIAFPGFSASAFSNHVAYQLTPHVALGYDFALHSLIFEPFILLDCVLNFSRGFQETGAFPLNMRVESFTSQVLRSEAGLALYQDVARDWGAAIFRETVAYVNKLYFGNDHLSATILETGSSFLFTGFNQTQNILTVGFEMLFKANNGLFGSLEYNGEFFSGYTSNALQGKIGLYF